MSALERFHCIFIITVIIIIFNVIIVIIVIVVVIITVIIISIIIIRYKSSTNTRKNIIKLQKNNVQNFVTKEHISVYKESQVSNGSNSTKTDKNKKDQNRNNEVKSVVITCDIMIKHLNGWEMSNNHNHSKKIKPNHLLNKGKLHSNKNGSNILSQTFVNEFSGVFN